MAQISRRHHHLTQHILRHFADRKGMLWMHERGRPARKVNVADAAVVKDLYSRGEPGGPKDDAIEKWLADHVDGPAAGVIGRILETDSLDLTDEERGILSRFVGAQDLRNPTARDHVIATLQGMFDEWWEEFDRSEFKAEAEAATGIAFSDEEIAEAIEEYDKTLDKSVWLDFFSKVDSAAAAIAARGRVLVRAAGSYEFLTNDVGLVKFAGDVGKTASPTPGFKSGGTHWVMPLSPTRALAIAPGDSGVVTSKQAMVGATNRAIVKTAGRFVYSRLPSQFVERWSADERRAPLVEEGEE